jgi:hypothetical protein
MTVIRLRILWLSLLFVLLCCPCAALAADVTVVPAVSVRGEYDDNVAFRRVLGESDYATTVTPAVTLDYETELLSLSSRAALAFLRYAQDESLDTENHWYGIGGAYRPRERWELRADGSYIKDTTLDSELEETGVVTLRQDRERYNGSGGATYRLSESSDVGFDFTHQITTYEGPSLDYDYDTVLFQYNREMSSLRDVFTIQPYYEYYKSDANQVESYALSLGWAHSFSETLSLTAFLGVRYTEIEYRFVRSEVVFDPGLLPSFPFRLELTEIEEKDSSWNGVGNISLRKTGETYSIRGGYVHRLGYNSVGDPLNIHRAYVNFSKTIHRRLRFGVSASAYATKSEGRLSREDSRYFSLTPTLNYRLTENHVLQAGYSYGYRRDKTVPDDRSYDRSRIWISLSFKFPRKW